MNTNIITKKSFWFYIGSDYRCGSYIHIYRKSSAASTTVHTDKNPWFTHDDAAACDEHSESKYEEDFPALPTQTHVEPDEEIPEYGRAREIFFELPKTGLRMYVVNLSPEESPIWYQDINDDSYKDIYTKIYTQIHFSMPFKVTGYTKDGFYKETGEYPADIPEKIKEMPDVLEKKILNKIPDGFDNTGDCFFFVIDSNGNDIYAEVLSPID